MRAVLDAEARIGHGPEEGPESCSMPTPRADKNGSKRAWRSLGRASGSHTRRAMRSTNVEEVHQQGGLQQSMDSPPEGSRIVRA